MPLLSTLPTGQRFTLHDSTYVRCTPTSWDALRSNQLHWLHGIEPQIQGRPDAVYVMQLTPDYGVLMLMPLDQEVEPLPSDAWQHKYRVTIEQPGKRDVYGADMLDAVCGLIRSIGTITTGIRVAIERQGQHINADGSACKEQNKGLQFRAVESRVVIGSINL